jgi:hypothetical protein
MAAIDEGALLGANLVSGAVSAHDIPMDAALWSQTEP